MRRLARFLLAPLAISIAMPAAAQIAGRHDGGPTPRATPFFDHVSPAPGVGRELRQTRRQIERARERGEITRSEARQLRREARRIGARAGRLGSDGLSPSEAGALRAQAQLLRTTVDRARRSGRGD